MFISSVAIDVLSGNNTPYHQLKFRFSGPYENVKTSTMGAEQYQFSWKYYFTTCPLASAIELLNLCPLYDRKVVV